MPALMKLQPGVTGQAEFSEDGNRRYRLTRQWDDGKPRNYALVIGMNPSKAGADMDDPTVRIETNYVRRLGYNRYVKLNVMDWIATHPRDLLAEEIEPCSERNMQLIANYAPKAGVIIAAWGAVHPRLEGYPGQVEHELYKHNIFCFGLTKNGSPRHPLRFLRMDSPLMMYKMKE